MVYNQFVEYTAKGPKVTANHWAVFVFYSSHVEQGIARSATEAQNQLLSLLNECEPGYAYGMTVEMRAGDIFQPLHSPEDRRGYFITEENGNLKLVDKMTVYSLASSVYNVRAGK